LQQLQNIECILKRTGAWNKHKDENEVSMVGVSDLDYSKDTKTRSSVTGYIAFLMDHL
jgi:hypothetical protein